LSNSFIAIWLNFIYLLNIILLHWFQVFIQHKQRSSFYTKKNNFLEKEMRSIPNRMKEKFSGHHIASTTIVSKLRFNNWIVYGWNHVCDAYFLSIEQIHSHLISFHMHAHTTDMKKRISKFCCFLSLKHTKNSAFCWSICSRRLRTWDVYPLCSHK